MHLLVDGACPLEEEDRIVAESEPLGQAESAAGALRWTRGWMRLDVETVDGEREALGARDLVTFAGGRHRPRGTPGEKAVPIGLQGERIVDEDGVPPKSGRVLS